MIGLVGKRPAYPDLDGLIVLSSGSVPTDLMNPDLRASSPPLKGSVAIPAPGGAADGFSGSGWQFKTGANLASYAEYTPQANWVNLGVRVPDLAAPVLSNGTLIARIYYLGNAANVGIVGRTPSGFNSGWGWYYNAGVLRAWFNRSTSVAAASGNFTIPTGQWVTLVTTWSADQGIANSYIDGRPGSSGTWGAGSGQMLGDVTLPLTIGNTDGGATGELQLAFDGYIAWIANVRHYMTPEEIRANWSGPRPWHWWGRRSLSLFFPTVYTEPTLLIGGVDSTDLIYRGDSPFEAPTFSWRRNQRAILTFDIEGLPAKRAEVLWYSKDGSTPIFGGFIERREPIEVPLDADYCSRVECVDFSRVYDWCYWTKNYETDRTLKQILQNLVDEKLSAYGISLDPSQADGPTFTAPFGWTNTRVSEVMKSLVGASSIDRITPLKVLKVFEAGSEAAPVSIDATNCSSLRWADSTQTPANTVICTFGADVNEGDDATITYEWTTDGVATSFAIDGNNIPGSREALPNVVVVDGTPYPIWPINLGSADDIHWDPHTDDGTLSFDGASAALVASPGLLISLTYFPRLPYSIVKTTGATPRIEVSVDHPKMWHWQQANDQADDDLAQYNQDDVRVFTIDTDEDGIFPGQTLPIDVAEREAGSTEGIVTAVQGVANTSLFWEYTVTAEEAEVLQLDAITDLKQQLGRVA